MYRYYPVVGQDGFFKHNQTGRASFHELHEASSKQEALAAIDALRKQVEALPDKHDQFQVDSSEDGVWGFETYDVAIEGGAPVRWEHRQWGSSGGSTCFFVSGGSTGFP